MTIVRCTNVFETIFFPNSKKLSPLKLQKTTSLFSFHLSYPLKLAYKIASLKDYDPLEHYLFFTTKVSPERPFVTLQGCLSSYASVNFDPDCIQTKISDPYPHPLKIFGHPFKDKALKTYVVPASQCYTHGELLFLAVQGTIFLSTINYIGTLHKTLLKRNLMLKKHFLPNLMEISILNINLSEMISQLIFKN